MSALKAVIYARLSKDDEKKSNGDNNNSIETQLRVCREYAEGKGYKVSQTYIDNDVSGGIPPVLRPAGGRLVAARDAHEFDVLVIVEPTRLYRSDMLPAELRRWQTEGVRVEFVGGEINMDDPNWELPAGLQGIIAQYIRRTASIKTHAGLASRALRKSWTGGKPYGYEPEVVGDRKVLIIVEKQRDIVREIFERYANGASCADIARDLNKRGVPSSGATWKRKPGEENGRRADGKWINSAVRVMLLNPIYTGQVRWNTSKWKLNEETGKYDRTERPEAQWNRYTYNEEGYRIVSDKLWQAVQKRMRQVSTDDPRLKSGGKAVYPLTGLLKCGVCGYNFVIDGATHYGCNGRADHACKNTVRVDRKLAEHYIIGAINERLLDPTVVLQRAKEIEREFHKRIADMQRKTANRPVELTSLEAKLARLKARLKAGDPDMTANDFQALIERTEKERAELMANQPAARAVGKVSSVLHKAAASYKAMLAGGISKHPQAATRARLAVRQLIGGPIKLTPKTDADGSSYLEAAFGLNRIALLSKLPDVSSARSGT